ncbi:phage tail assembly chaperone [Variovorax sp. J22R193]|uniref:phage tail assembly chaperone n=1 Tax=Variovorax fucosicus TaxID=3053517 RepID=UPI0025753F6C|nr:phage tail assembly chaperone [Variovorax sp. J22R193]MDM0041881.1 phage tail assembly chaperone [Variovorax sp. J22R193]
MFKLKADPTFQAKVAFPVFGGASVDVQLTFKHRTKAELAKWLEEGRQTTEGSVRRTDEQTFFEMVVGWEIDEPFNKENVAILLDHHIGVALATYQTYIDELTRHREKN